MHGEDASKIAVEEYRRRSYTNWEAAAPGWDRERAVVDRTTQGLTTWLVDACDPRPGETLLELAAGTGAVSIELAARVAPNGRVICTDRSPSMVDFARAAAAQRDLAGIEHRVADAEHLELGDASVDGVCCRLGYMLMPDPTAAFTETRRVLRPGGRVAFVVWDAAGHNPWATVLWDVIERLTDVPRTPPGSPGMFALGDAGLVTRLLAVAGLGSVEVAALPMAWEYADFDELWRVQTALNGALAQLVPTLPDSDAERLRAAVRDAVAPFATDAGGLSLPGRALGVRARRSRAAS